MNSLSMRKYKDELPKNTINRIRNILNDLDILTIENVWENSVDGFYSVNISIANTNLFSNGKGTTHEYALASAYGELIERLQNQAYFRPNMDLSSDALMYKGFNYAPDEKHINIKDLMNSKNDWFEKQMSNVESNIDKYELLKKWVLLSHENISSDFITIPYFNMRNNSISYIPIKMIEVLYGSNGMCAGNTPEEALVQGISEILERVANIEVLRNKVIPPTIPREYIEKFPKIDSMIKGIESKGNYNVIIKDCSLEQGYPVVGLIFVNKNEQIYSLKFGAHPIFEMAVERTLTEFLQGRDINNMKGVKEFSYKNDSIDTPENFLDIMTKGSGYYPTNIFSQKFSYKFKEFKDFRKLSNKEMLTYLITLLEKKGYDIFVRNTSFLGFPSFHIIVPGLSEFFEVDNVKLIERYINFNKITKYIKNLKNATNKELEDIIKYIINCNYSIQQSITKLLNVPIKKSFPWSNIKIDLFIGAAYYKLGNFIRAYESFNKFIEYIETNSYNKGAITYYKCVRDYIGSRIDNLEEQDTIDILNTFYPSNIVREVITNLRNHEQIFDCYGQLDCWNCKQCNFKLCCLYNSIEKVYKTLKNKYASNKIDQNDVKELLNLESVNNFA